MARKTKQEKFADAAAETAFQKFSDGRPINIFDIGKVLQAGRDAYIANQDVDKAVLHAFEKYVTK